MLEKKQLEKYLSACMRSEADFAEIFEQSEKDETISMLNGKVEDVNRITISGIGIRLYKGVQSVYAYGNETDEESVMKLIDDLRTALGAKEEGPEVSLQRIEYENRHPVKIDFDESFTADIDTFADRIWKALNEDNKVSLFVRFIDIETGEFESRIINKNV